MVVYTAGEIQFPGGGRGAELPYLNYHRVYETDPVEYYAPADNFPAMGESTWRGRVDNHPRYEGGGGMGGVYAIFPPDRIDGDYFATVSYTHLRANETRHELVCRLMLEK